jgi:hypothetical protein
MQENTFKLLKYFAWYTLWCIIGIFVTTLLLGFNMGVGIVFLYLWAYNVGQYLERPDDSNKDEDTLERLEGKD